MRMVNRTVVVLHPRQPFIDWVRRDQGDGAPSPAEILEVTNAYLVPEVRRNDDKERFLRAHFQEMFEQELEAWSDAPEFWPAKRDLRVFRSWFDVEYLEIVMDLAREELQREDDDDRDEWPRAGYSPPQHAAHTKPSSYPAGQVGSRYRARG